MATENKILDLGYVAAEDLTNDQYRFVVLGSTGVRRPDSETEIALGILQNAPAINEAAAVRVIGVSKLQMNDALAVNGTVMAEYVSAADAGKGKTAAAAPAYARGLVLEASGAEDDLASVLLLPVNPGVTAITSVTTVTTDATVGARTYTAAELVGGLVLRDPNGAARADVSPAAADIVAEIAGAIIGSSFEFVIKNTADADETLTLTAGAGVTLSGGVTIPYNHTRKFLAVCTNVTGAAEAVTIYGLGLEPNTMEKVSRSTAATVTTGGAATYTAAQLLGGLVLRDPNGAARADVSPTAALLVAAIPGAVVGTSFEFTIRNNADADETITLTAGVGVTLSGGVTIPFNHTRRFLAVCTNVTGAAEAITIYSGGLEPHTMEKVSRSTVATVATEGAATYTAAQLLGGLILRDPAGDNRADVSPTAALLVAAIPGAVVGTSFEFTIRNTADAGETITVTAGDGVTLSGTMTIAQNNTKRFLAVCTNVTGAAEAVTIYSLGTIVH